MVLGEFDFKRSVTSPPPHLAPSRAHANKARRARASGRQPAASVSLVAVSRAALRIDPRPATHCFEIPFEGTEERLSSLSPSASCRKREQLQSASFLASTQKGRVDDEKSTTRKIGVWENNQLFISSCSQLFLSEVLISKTENSALPPGDDPRSGTPCPANRARLAADGGNVACFHCSQTMVCRVK